MSTANASRARFAPTPSGRMHLGNLFAALLCFLDARARGAELILRMEDLDRERCRPEYAKLLADDLRWLGLSWDVGWEEGRRDFLQSERREYYEAALHALDEKGLIYPCYCKRRERLAANAPHLSDGSVRYEGRCRSLDAAQRLALEQEGRKPALRVCVPTEQVSFVDGNYGPYMENLKSECGDFILRRSDGVFAYQLAVVVDDALMGVTRVVRGHDLLSSTPRQLWLFSQLGFDCPSYCHTPLLLDSQGRRLSKRDRDLDMGALRSTTTKERLLGILAHLAGLLERPEAISAPELVPLFSWDKVGRADRVIGEDVMALLHS